MKRAQRLVREAKERAYSTKIKVAWANYWTAVTKTSVKVTFGSGAILLEIDREASRLVPGGFARERDTPGAPMPPKSETIQSASAGACIYAAILA